jgi:hypothetical protein
LDVQEYMAQWVAKMAGRKAEYLEAVREMDLSVAPEGSGRGGRGRKISRARAPEGAAPSAAGAAASLSNEEVDPWYFDAIDLLEAHAPAGGQLAADHIKDQLSEADTYA